MEHENYELHIDNWTSSLMELDDGGGNLKSPETTTALVSLTPTYYRSKAFSSTIGINNLINAADPILTLATKLRRVTTPPDIISLHQNLCHEIKAFENRAETLGFRPQVALAARYAICALLDELITITAWPNTDEKKYSLVEIFHKEMLGNDQFFLILERCLQDPGNNLELLELIYLCLKLGYEGKYRGMDRGLQELCNITDYLYATIVQQREEFSRSLHVCLVNPNYQQTKKSHLWHFLPSVWIISTIMLLTLVILFSFFYFKLAENARPINQFLNQLHHSEIKTKDLYESA